MKLFYLPVFVILFKGLAIAPADPMDKIADLIRHGNIHELAKLFAPNIEIAITDDENVYTQAQAEIILDKFFAQNKLRSVKILHKVTSNPNYRFGVLIVSTDRGPYRVAYTLKDTGGSLLIIELRIEVEKVK
jgi:hypothetical protein